MENYLQQAVDCIRKQTMDDYELILVNDASKDHSLKMLLNRKTFLKMKKK